MNHKPIIAIDIDDVLSLSAEGLVAYTNERWGTHLKVEDYGEDWGKMWQIEHDTEEMEKRAEEVHAVGVFGRTDPKDDAKRVLEKLHESFRITLVTSRRRRLSEETDAWIQKHFYGVIDDIVYAGIYDRDGGRLTKHHERLAATKQNVLRELSPAYFIDDQLKHCYAATELNIRTILFGGYSWNQDPNLPKNIMRCRTWLEVEKYFDSKQDGDL